MGRHKQLTCGKGHDNWVTDSRGKRYCKPCATAAHRPKYLAKLATGWRPRSGKWGKLKREFGMSESDYNRVNEEQAGLCAICHRPETSVFKGKQRALAVDHDHATGKVRSLLCMKCNTAIGAMDDDVTRILSAAEYIRKWQ